MSGFLGGIFDDIGSSISSFFGGGDTPTGSGGANPDALSSILSAASGALSSPMQTPSSPSNEVQGPSRAQMKDPQQAFTGRGLVSVDPRQLNDEWMARMHNFRSLTLATHVPNYKGGE